MPRPIKEIDRGEFEKLCAMQCTEEEISAFFDCCEDTLNAWCKRTYKDENGNPMCFSDVFKLKRKVGRVSLRRKQWRLADRNPSMAIFLGKQYLGQTDSPIGDTGGGEVVQIEWDQD